MCHSIAIFSEHCTLKERQSSGFRKAVATVKPCRMYDGHYRFKAESEIMAAKCIDEKLLSEIKSTTCRRSVRGVVANVRKYRMRNSTA